MIIRSNTNTTSTGIDPNSVNARIERSRQSTRPSTSSSSFTSLNSIRSNLPLHLAFLNSNSGNNTTNTTTRRIPGPPAPPSWSSSTSSSTSSSFSNSSKSIKNNSRNNNLSHPSHLSTHSSSSSSSTNVKPLHQILFSIILKDLNLSRKKSIYIDFIHFLPRNLRIDLMHFAGSGFGGIGLNERGVLGLLIEDEDEKVVEVEESWDLEEEEEEGDWESKLHHYPDLSHDFHTSLTTLNLGYSTITTSFLSSLLLRPQPTNSTSNRPTRIRIPTFSNLSSLLLPHVVNIKLDDPELTELFSWLISVRSLDLRGVGVGLIDSNWGSSRWLTKLARSTPGLVFVDLSEIQFSSSIDNSNSFSSSTLNLPQILVKLNWSIEWLNLKKLKYKDEKTSSNYQIDDEYLDAFFKESIQSKMGTNKRWIEYC